MYLRKGQMWDCFDEADLFLVTTNGTIVNDRLVMGGGSAAEAVDRFPGVDRAMARVIKREGTYDPELKAWKYHLLTSERGKLGAFQTKYDVWQPADLTCIATAVLLLKNFLIGREILVHMPFPGIGLGQLRREDVLPYIKQLPDNVHIWEYGNETE